LGKRAQNDQIKLSLSGRIVNDIRIRDTAVAVALRAGLTADGLRKTVKGGRQINCTQTSGDNEVFLPGLENESMNKPCCAESPLTLNG